MPTISYAPETERDTGVNPIAQYYRDEIRKVNADYMIGATTYEHLTALADEYLDWMRHRKATAPKGSNIAKMRIPNRGYILRALA